MLDKEIKMNTHCTETTECDNCEQIFNYSENDEIEIDDYDYDENPITIIYVFCPHCKEKTRVGCF